MDGSLLGQLSSFQTEMNKIADKVDNIHQKLNDRFSIEFFEMEMNRIHAKVKSMSQKLEFLWKDVNNLLRSCLSAKHILMASDRHPLINVKLHSLMHLYWMISTGHLLIYRRPVSFIYACRDIA